MARRPYTRMGALVLLAATAAAFLVDLIRDAMTLTARAGSRVGPFPDAATLSTALSWAAIGVVPAIGVAGYLLLRNGQAELPRWQRSRARAASVALVVAAIAGAAWYAVGLLLSYTTLPVPDPGFLRPALLLVVALGAGLFLYWTSLDLTSNATRGLSLAALVVGVLSAGVAFVRTTDLRAVTDVISPRLRFGTVSLASLEVEIILGLVSLALWLGAYLVVWDRTRLGTGGTSEPGASTQG